MADSAVERPLDLSGCDREPIHAPEAIQPHGLLLVLDPGDLTVRRGAGPIEALTGRADWLGRPLPDLLGATAARRVSTLRQGGYVGRWRAANGLEYDLILHLGELQHILEIEQSSQGGQPGVELIARLDAAGAALERAPTVKAVCESAAEAFRVLTGYDRIMIYRFLDDEAGQVVAEARSAEMDSFQNHHFPASDIPRQARALYLRNPVRVIPDATYTPQPLRPESATPLDMSGCGLRSVSPVHLQYLRNMGVRASASVSIIIDDVLWGLVACHGVRPQLLPYELRLAATTLARTLARQIKAKAEAELYRERVRLRLLEDGLLARMTPDVPAAEGLAAQSADLIQLPDADGVAILDGDDLLRFGVCPGEAETRALADWVAAQPGLKPVAAHVLSEVWPAAADWPERIAGLLAVRLAGERPLTLLWFRAEIVETVRWAGNPSTAVKTGPAGSLTPRASFDAWTETVRGRARRWTPAAVDSVARLRDALADLTSVGQLRSLNRTLQANLSERELRLEQQAYLIREVNHRVQNSLTLVSSFLGLQARLQGDEAARNDLLEARRRVRAVSMVHSRLHHSEPTSKVDLGRYFTELLADLGASMGADWAAALEADLAPITVDAGRAVTVGLVLTELVINAQKYAYDGAPGPLRVRLEETGSDLRLTVEDDGKGGAAAGEGFGSLMIRSLVDQLGGAVERTELRPGLRVVLRAAIDPLT